MIPLVELRPTRGEAVRACWPNGEIIVVGEACDVLEFLWDKYPEAEVVDLRVPEFIPAE